MGGGWVGGWVQEQVYKSADKIKLPGQPIWGAYQCYRAWDMRWELCYEGARGARAKPEYSTN